MTMDITTNSVGGLGGLGLNTGGGIGVLLLGLLLGRGNLLGGDCGGRCAAPAVAAASGAQDTILSMMMQAIQAGVANANQNAAFTNSAVESVKEAVCMNAMNAQSNFMQLQNGQNQLAASAALTACQIQNQIGQTATSRDVWNLDSKIDQLACKVSTGVEAIIANNNLRSQEIMCMIQNTAKDARIAALEEKVRAYDLTLRDQNMVGSIDHMINSKFNYMWARNGNSTMNILSPGSTTTPNAVNTPVSIGN